MEQHRRSRSPAQPTFCGQGWRLGTKAGNIRSLRNWMAAMQQPREFRAGAEVYARPRNVRGRKTTCYAMHAQGPSLGRGKSPMDCWHPDSCKLLAVFRNAEVYL